MLSFCFEILFVEADKTFLLNRTGKKNIFCGSAKNFLTLYFI